MRRRYIVAGAAALLVVAVFYLLLLKPRSTQIGEVRGKVEQAQSTQQSLRIKLKQLTSAQQSAPETMARLAKLGLLLPQTPDLPSLIRQLQDAATASGMDLVSIAPSQPQPLAGATGISTIGVSLQVSGGFFRTESFLARLEDLQRVLEVTSLTLSPTTEAETGISTLQTSLTMRMYQVMPGAHLGAATAKPQPSPSPSP